MERTYYRILGVSRTESPSGIHAAYRDLAKRLHPDVAGSEWTRAFQEVTEAYQVLSDPERRRRYNDELSRSESRGGTSAPRGPPRPSPGKVGPPEEVRTDRPFFGAVPEPLFREGARRSAPEPFPRWGRRSVSEPLDFEVVLTPQEALGGCVVPVAVPVRCPLCGGARLGRGLSRLHIFVGT